jgi:Lrp/AsnC family leucine-responsive transcriptional regulator
MTVELDDFDRRILEMVQKDSRQPAEKIGDEIGLSASAVQRRLARLRQSGVIIGEIAVVDPKAVERPLTLIVDVELERERPDLLQSFRRWIDAEPAIQQAWYVTGDGDYVLIVTARDVETYDALMQQMTRKNANVRRFHTRVALGTLKRGLALPTKDV